MHPFGDYNKIRQAVDSVLFHIHVQYSFWSVECSQVRKAQVLHSQFASLDCVTSRVSWDIDVQEETINWPQCCCKLVWLQQKRCNYTDKSSMQLHQFLWETARWIAFVHINMCVPIHREIMQLIYCLCRKTSACLYNSSCWCLLFIRMDEIASWDLLTLKYVWILA